MDLNIPMSTQGALDLSSIGGDMPSGSTVMPTATQVPSGYPNQNSGGMQYGAPLNMNQAPRQPQPQTSSTGVILKKGQKTALTGSNGQSLTAIEVGLGWDVVNVACDLDASAFMLGEDRRVIGDSWFVFYGQTSSPDNSVLHSGDSKGEGYGDDEIISIDLTRINAAVKRIVFVVTIDEAFAQGLNFSMVRNAYVRVTDRNTNRELVRFNLTDYYANVTSMVVGEIYLHNGQWKFNAVGDGVARDLAGLCAMYGVNVKG